MFLKKKKMFSVSGFEAKIVALRNQCFVWAQNRGGIQGNNVSATLFRLGEP